jgi:hypothetical protein
MQNQDYDVEHDERYIAEYQKTLQSYANLVTNHPEIIDQLRDVLKTSARSMVSNHPKAITDFEKMVEELDAFLIACKTGEIDPKQFAAEAMPDKQ